ncbi:MAG: PP2C family protein-serine/threonine phosphatase [Planctomycetota bacterium]|jgi:sigma-B regulation protein RsbU (phosphoserine phosphatase)
MTLPQTEQRAPAKTEANPGNLLVVDDNEMNRDMLSRRLARRGHIVETADGGRAALDLISQRPFDVVLLDIMMPDIDGIEVLKTVRKDYSAADLPIIMATAKDESDDIVSALKLGANDYVTKPLDFQVVLARVQTQLSLKRAKEELSTAHARMKRDLEAAAKVQQAQLPAAAPASDRVRFAWTYRPCDELAGDALNIFKIDDRHIGVYVLDVSGHGVPAALLSVSVTHSLSQRGTASSIITEPTDAQGGFTVTAPALVAERLNRQFPMADNANRYFTLVYGVLDTQTGRFRFVTAGHPGPLIVRADGSEESVEEPGFPVGIVDGAEFDDMTVELRAGDRLYLHSDGVNEEMDRDGEMFGRTRTRGVLVEHHTRPLDDVLARVVEAVTAWKGDGDFSDDISLVALEMAGA